MTPLKSRSISGSLFSYIPEPNLTGDSRSDTHPIDQTMIIQKDVGYAMAGNKITDTSYELSWRFEQRVAFEHLGSQKYSTSTRALGELVSNAFDAGAECIKIEIKRNELKGIDSISVADNGRGISPAQIKDRFVIVGVQPTADEEQQTTHFGRFGVGRLAVCRIGSISKWVTVSEVNHTARVQSTFTVRLNDNSNLKVEEKAVPKSTPLGTIIDIYNLRDSDEESLSPTRISNDLLTQFCSYLLGNPNKHIYVQGEELDVKNMVEITQTEQIEQLQESLQPAIINHLLLSKPVDRSRFKDQYSLQPKGAPLLLNSRKNLHPLAISGLLNAHTLRQL